MTTLRRNMPGYIALLRAINVGTGRTIRMADLRTMFEQGGATEVETYIQSGNVVFTHASRSESALAKKLEATITKAAGFAVPVLLRTATEMAAVLKKNPFASADSVHVYFLPEKPDARVLADVDPEPFLPDAWKIVGREVYVSLPNGVGRSKLVATILRKPPLTSATGRNWRTIEKLEQLASHRKA